MTCPVANFAKSSNIDAQDAQDEGDESLLQEEPAPAMIVCGFADAQDHKLAVS